MWLGIGMGIGLGIGLWIGFGRYRTGDSIRDRIGDKIEPLYDVCALD